MPMLHKQWSADDVLAGSLASSNSPGRRARSASPSKRRPLSQSAFDLQSLLNGNHSSSSLHEDIASKLSSGALSPEQIKRLSRSPIARKLHISSSQHALPIPFKLQLPPKLSNKSAPPSPRSSREHTVTSTKPSEKALPPCPDRQSPHQQPPPRPTRLIFNGSAYEPAESSESESDLSFLKHLGPQKPPATICNRKKVARFAQKHQTMPLDQLSMIEEASNASSSRTSSVKKADTLPPTPTSQPPASRSSSQKARSPTRKPPPGLECPAPVVGQKPRLELVSPPPPPIQLPSSISAPVLAQNRPEFETHPEREEKGPSTDSSFDVPRRLDTRVATEAPRIRPETASYSSPKQVQAPGYPFTPKQHSNGQFDKEDSESPQTYPITPVDASATPRQGIPHTHAYHYKLNLGEGSYLKIPKRSFSDESKVSSVSSFSSVGDLLSMHQDPAVRYFNNEQTAVSARYYAKKLSRGNSSASNSSSATQSSWNSIQKSVDLSVADSLLASEKSSLSSRSVSTRGDQKAFRLEESEENSFAHETQPLNIVRQSGTEKQLANDSSSKEVPEVSAAAAELEKLSKSAPEVLETNDASREGETDDEGKEDVSADDGNFGLGKGFSFPNNMSNITNSEEAKKRLSSQRMHARSRSAVSFDRSSGQIQIPDAEELDSLSLRPISETRVQGVSFNDFQKLRLNGADKENVSDIEPIGVPSEAAKQHLSHMYGSLGSSETDSSFEDNEDDIKKPLHAPPKEMPTSVSLEAIATRKSPIRHARHRSMYSIDFVDIYQDPTPKNSISRGKPGLGHKASKSLSIASEAPRIVLDRTKTVNDSTKDKTVREPTEEEQEPALNIVVAEPPKRVQYAVDFKEAASPKKPDPSFGQKFGTPYYQHSLRRNGTRRSNKSTSEQSNEVSKCSQSMFSGSLVTARETISTAPTDTDSVIIDLTEEDYNVCMIKRNDSTLSYRSVIEKRNGKPVEVVLVEEDEEDPSVSREDRDDLSSIYSRYMSGWERQKLSLQAKAKRRIGSESSDASGSWVSSETGFQLKPNSITEKHKPQVRQATMPSLGLARKSQQAESKTAGKRIQSTPKLDSHNAYNAHNRGNSVYFDYTGNEKYDFDSFMQQRL